MDLAPLLIHEAEKSMRAGKTHYQPIAGIPELRKESADWMNKTYQSNFGLENVIVTCGGKHGLGLVLQALLDPGDEALVVSPYWVSYPGMIQLFGGVPKVIETKEQNGWKLKSADIASVCSKKTKFLIFNNASNPTGVLYTKEEIEQILCVAKENNLTVVSDEVYSGLVYGGQNYISCSSFSKYKDSVIVVQSCSKNFAMTGLRVGLVFGPERLVKVLTTLQGQSTTGTSSASQWMALAAYQNAEELIVNIRNKMSRRSDVFVDKFNNIFPQKISNPSSALYCFIPIRSFGVDRSDSVAFCKKILDDANVALVPGAAFGAEGFVRASFGESESKLIDALTVLSKYLRSGFDIS